MVEDEARTLSPPPAYNEAISSSIYTITVPSTDLTPPPPVFEFPTQHRPIPPTTPPTSSSSRQNQWQPPSYDSLFGIRGPKIATSSTNTADSASASAGATTSAIPEPPASRRQTDSRSDSPSAQTDVAERREKCKKWFKLMLFVCTLAGSIALTTIASIKENQCPANNGLPLMMKSSGVAGIVYALALGLFYWKKSKDAQRHKPILHFILPLIVIILYFIGMFRMQDVWTHKPCYPGVGDGCSEIYCDDLLMHFSLAFYTTTGILLLPLWLLILYLFLRPIFLCIKNTFCNDCRCEVNENKIFACLKS